jgi:hypothetical protein
LTNEPLSKAYPQLVRRLREVLTPQIEEERLIVTADLGTELPDLMKLTQSVRGVAHRAKSQNNLKQLGIAIHSYHDVHGFLPTDVRDADGKPLLSWRVLLLPYLEQEPLYRRFKLDEPWDSENNKPLLALMPEVLRSPMQAKELKDRTKALRPLKLPTRS